MIRPATLTEADMVGACTRAAFARYVPRMGREPAPMLVDPAAAILRGEIHVATAPDGCILGHVICRADGPEMLLETLAVWPEHAGCGIGRRLVAHVEMRARQQGLSAVTLYTNAVMTENLPFYDALGYACTGRHCRNGFDRVYFRKTLGWG